MTLVIHAPNVHRGGGRALLTLLLEVAEKRRPAAALLDQRLELPEKLSLSLAIKQVAATVSGRLAGE